MKSQVELSNMLTVLAQMVRNMPDDQFSQMIGENGSGLSRRPKSSGKAQSGLKTHAPSIPPALAARWETLSSNLGAAATRDEGARILENAFSKKDEWVGFARFLDLPVQKRDSLARIRGKIVEYLVGSRLDSAAIRGGYSVGEDAQHYSMGGGQTSPHDRNFPSDGKGNAHER